MEELDVKIHLCTKKELEEEAEKHGSKPWYGLKYLRGFRYGNEIWVVKECFGELALLAHEYGHIRGKKHCRFPSIMNFSGLFHIFAFHPFDILKLLRQSGTTKRLCKKLTSNFNGCTLPSDVLLF